MRRIAGMGWCILLVWSVLPFRAGLAQDRPAAGTRVLEASELAAAFPGLRKTIAVHFEGKPIEQALRDIAAKADLALTYSDLTLPKHSAIWLTADRIRADEALETVLAHAGLQLLPLSNGRLVVVSSRQGVGGPTGTIMGQVTDAKTGLAIAGADVGLDRGQQRTATDTGGRYRLAAVDAGTYTMTVRKFGYAKLDRQVTVRENATDTVDMALQPVVTRLNELVSTATGMRRRMDIANDVTTINADSVVRTQPITSVTDLLETRVPGLTVQRTSGAPGDPARLRLRGAGSPLRSNDPIVIVDGVRVYAEQSAGRNANLATTDLNSNTNYAAPSPLDYVDPNTIETVEVIKGPSAATLYGPDAANGVIVITTKKGKPGPTRWTFGVDHGQSRVPGNFPGLTIRWGHQAYSGLANQQCSRTGFIPDFNQPLRLAPCVADSVVTYQMLNDPALTVLDPGNRNAFTLSTSGGSQTLTYAITGSYQREVGLFKLPGYEADQYQTLHGGQTPPDWMLRPQRLTQWGVSSRLQARLGSTADVTLSAQFSRTAQQRSSLEQQLGALLTTFFDRASDTYYRPNDANKGGPIANYTGDVLASYYERVTDAAAQFTNGLNFSWRPRPWLTVTSDAGLNVQQRDDEALLPYGAVAGIVSPSKDTTGHLGTGHGSALTSTVNLRGAATVPLKLGLRLNLAAGVNYTGRSINDAAFYTYNLAPGTSSLGTIVSGTHRSVQDNATFGWYVEQSLGHRKFSLTTGLRLDGGSTYGTRVSSSGSGALPKLGFSYLVSDEPFFPFKDLFQSFRLRTSYGRASRQPGITDRLRLYTTATSQWVDGQLGNAVGLQNLGNTELRPERTTEFEGGFDADLLASRLSLGFTLYRKTTDDALLNFPLAPSVYGDHATILKNIGVVRNSGIEVSAQAQLVRSGPVTWGGDLTVSRNRSLVVRLAPGVLPFYVFADGIGVAGSGSSPDGSGLRVAPGYPLFGRWAFPILGYADANGDGALETSEVLVGDTAVYMGSSLPNYQLDLKTNVSFWQGAVTLSAGLHYDDGLAQRNDMALNLAPFSSAWNSATSTLAEQAATIYLPTTDFNWIQTVNVVRFQSLALAYRVPSAVARRVGAQTLNVAVQGTNLGLWTNYRGLDPNVNRNATGNAVSDSGVLPQPRTWQVRINATY